MIVEMTCLTWTEDNLLRQVSCQGSGRTSRQGRSFGLDQCTSAARQGCVKAELRSSRRSRRKRKDRMAPGTLYDPVPGSRCHAPMRCLDRHRAVVGPERHEFAVDMQRAERFP